MLKIISIVGARPQFIKAAVLRELFEKTEDITEILIHTGQHYDVSMSDIFFKDLNINPAEYKLGIHGSGAGDTTGRMLAEIEKVLVLEKPDAVLVYGDTNSTLAGALAATKLHIPLIHVEAGLRSFNKKMPEEINRILTDHVSDILFCSTQTGIDNLKNEGITDNVFHVGDIMYDATLRAIREKEFVKELQGIDLTVQNIAACTIHRAENTDNPKNLKEIFHYLREQCNKYQIILPIHPRTKKAIQLHNVDTGRINLIDTIGYFEMQALLSASKIVFTDSGGLQKEAFFHQVPCVTLRNETEWVELVSSGWNRLWKNEDFLKPRFAVQEYGVGDCGVKIVEHLRKQYKK
jgi:UDP-GlcNAc3NAcA epimerase